MGPPEVRELGRAGAFQVCSMVLGALYCDYIAMR